MSRTTPRPKTQTTTPRPPESRMSHPLAPVLLSKRTALSQPVAVTLVLMRIVTMCWITGSSARTDPRASLACDPRPPARWRRRQRRRRPRIQALHPLVHRPYYHRVSSPVPHLHTSHKATITYCRPAAVASLDPLARVPAALVPAVSPITTTIPITAAAVILLLAA